MMAASGAEGSASLAVPPSPRVRLAAKPRQPRPSAHLRAASAWMVAWCRSAGSTFGSSTLADGPPAGSLRASATNVR